MKKLNKLLISRERETSSQIVVLARVHQKACENNYEGSKELDLKNRTEDWRRQRRFQPKSISPLVLASVFSRVDSKSICLMLKLSCSRHGLPLRDCVLSSCSSLILLGSKSLRFHFSQEYGGGLVPATNQSYTVHLHNRPFYSCGLSTLAFQWLWGWRWLCFDTNLLYLLWKLPLKNTS